MKPADLDRPTARRSESGRVTMLGLLVDLALALAKGAAGILGASSAMLADALHSLADFATDVVVWFSLKLASKPPDEDHPYGHGRYETIGTLILVLVLFGTAIGIAVDAWGRLGDVSVPGTVALWVAAASILVKEALFRITMRVSRREGSPLLAANAWHHRSDALSSIAALLGIAGAKMGYPILDPMAAIVVAVLIGHMAFRLFGEATREVTESVLQREMLAELRSSLIEVPGVVNLHELRARRMGRSVLVDLHVEVEGAITVSDGHQVAERVRQSVLSTYDEVVEVLVHVDPEPDDDVAPGDNLAPPRQEIEAAVRRVAADLGAVEGVTHVHVHFLGGKVTVQVDIVLASDLRVREAGTVATALRAKIEALPDVDRADIHLELDDQAHDILSDPPVRPGVDGE